MTEGTIAILDDESDRIDAMVPVIRQLFPGIAVVTFDNAPDMTSWFSGNLDSCVLICLDHDLGSNRLREGVLFDPGIGRDVADYLATQKPACPIVIHTTNTQARPGMIFVLEEAGWSVSYVSPYEDLLWVKEEWANSVRKMLRKDLV